MSATAYSGSKQSPRDSGYYGSDGSADGHTEDADLATWRQRYKDGLADRRRFEPAWQLCQAFIQNRQWVGWHINERRVVELPNPDDRERVTVNVLTQYLWTFIGKITQDDFRPDVTWRLQDIGDRALARQARKAVEYGWEEEWDADEALLEALLYEGVFGTSAIRVRPDLDYTATLGRHPLHPDTGRPIMGPSAEEQVDALRGEGREIDYKELHEGRLLFEPLSPFNTIVPPGLVRERDFPWLIVERPVELSVVQGLYPEAAAGLKPEAIRQVDMIGVRDPDGISAAPGGTLKGHVLLKTGYELPCPNYPGGRTFVWAQGQKLDGREELPLTANRQPHHGVVFFHYHRVPGRFWALGTVEPGIGPQRQRNRARSQWIELKDRAGLGRVYAYKGTISEVSKPKGGVFETVWVTPGVELPKETTGTPPGPWLKDEVEQNDLDLDKVMGVREVSLGQAPAGVSAYSAFALLAEQDDRRVGPVLKHFRIRVAMLTKLAISGMRRYWLPNKLISLAGDDPDGLLDAFIFDASQLPDDVFVKIGQGAPLPQSQAAEAQKIFDIFDRAISSGQPLPLSWLVDSLGSMKALPLPENPNEEQQRIADYENVMIVHGHMVSPHPGDVDELHIQRHQAAVAALSLIPTMAAQVEALQIHIQAHLQQAAGKQQMQVPSNNGMQAAPPQGTPGQNAGIGMMSAAPQPDPTALMGERASAAMVNRMSPGPVRLG